MATLKTKSSDPKRIEGIPSKDLFINMLIKDITLKDAIGDLVDNSVDAAYKWAKRKNDLSNFKIHISLDKNHFEIIDNAGGIEENVARESAFKLGKPKNFKFDKHTIGQFGIGMKRAFFKLGEHITVRIHSTKFFI
jgi:HSP90 family molecular chaperone